MCTSNTHNEIQLLQRPHIYGNHSSRKSIEKTFCVTVVHILLILTFSQISPFSICAQILSSAIQPVAVIQNHLNWNFKLILGKQ